jgi:methylmalonyl-CoA mutase N-terminal domain/subunit
VLGGVQSLALSCYDEALSIPTEKAQRIAVRTQQIIGEEIGVTNTVDPLGGSYFVEWLTDELERRATALLAEVDARGGAVACIESGWMQEQIQDEAYRAELAVVSGEKVVVGVNRYTESEEANPPVIFRTDDRAGKQQLERLQAHREQRDSTAVAATLERLQVVASGTDELMPAILDAVRADATLGEICGTLRDVFGEYQPPTTI